MSAKSKKRRAAAAHAEPSALSGLSLMPLLERRASAMAIALVLLATVRIIATYTVFTHTYDEPGHIATGIEWIETGHYRFQPEQPPLSGIAMAIGPYLMGARGQHTPTNAQFAVMVEGLKILYSGNYDNLLSAARAGILPFFWVACAVVWFWGVRYFGRLEALAAVFLFTFLEPVLAHAGMATTDMALTAFLGAAFLSGAIWLEEPTPRRAAIFGLCAGLAVISKYSSLAFFPACAAIALAAYAWIERPKAGELGPAITRRLPGLALAAGIVCVVIVTVFRFSWGNSGIAGMKLPAPEFFQGIRDVAKHNAEGHPGYLLGQRSESGFWYFYPVVLAVKTPLAFLFLLAMGTPLVLRRGAFRLGWLPMAYAAGVLAVALFSRINIGVRHILPVYTGFSLVAGVAVIHLWRMGRESIWRKIAVTAALLWFGVTSLAAHPDYLPYFNELAGSHPENILVDSDLDWGQDYKRLAARLQELNARQVAFTPFPMTVLGRHGFPLLAPTNPQGPMGGWNAVGVSTWKERRLNVADPKVKTEAWWMDQYEPTEKVGKTIYLWYFPMPGENQPWPKPRR
jgi:hypothetical protein